MGPCDPQATGVEASKPAEHGEKSWRNPQRYWKAIELLQGVSERSSGSAEQEVHVLVVALEVELLELLQVCLIRHVRPNYLTDGPVGPVIHL